MNLREQVMNECINYKTNFEGIDELEINQTNYMVVKNNGNEFDGCPQRYDCLENSDELCIVENINSSVEQCMKCWRNALKE